MRNFWLFISILMHPLLLISYSYLILFYALPYYKARFYDEDISFLLLYIFANTFVLPTIAVLVMKKIGMIATIYLNERTERIFPYILTTLFCAITTYQLYNTQIGELSYRFMLGVTFVIGAVSIINFWFKISAHAAAAAGVVALLLYTIVGLNEGVMVFWMLSFIILSGLSATSRLALGVHKPNEIYWGFLLGFSVVFLSVAL